MNIPVGENLVVQQPPKLELVKPTKVFAIDIETHGQGGKVGDCAGNQIHGIAGISVCNSHGVAFYCQCNDGRDYGAVPVKELIEYLNQHWFQPESTAIFHNSKFDLHFLMSRGLKLNGTRVRDTWALSSIEQQGIFKSNKLKDLVRTKFGVDTQSETTLKDWLKANGTEDYGDIPLDIIGPYACDDVRYTVALAVGAQYDPRVVGLHDLVVRNSMWLNEAELRGIRVDVNTLRFDIADKTRAAERDKQIVIDLLGAVELPKEDPEDQALMQILHHKSLHPAAREYYGELKFLPDITFCKATKNEVSQAFGRYAANAQFVKAFSGARGDLAGRIWSRSDVAGVYPSFLISLFSRGGIPLAKKPNFADGVDLTPDVRKYFIAREGYQFVIVKGKSIMAELLAYYTSNDALKQLLVEAETEKVCAYLGSFVDGCAATGFALMRKICEGSGTALFERRLQVLGVRPGIPGVLADKFDRSLPGYSAFGVNLRKLLRSGQGLMDPEGRLMMVPAEKEYRRRAILLQSAFGSIVAKYLDLCCKVARGVGAHLAFVHKDEFVFETDNPERAQKAFLQLFKTPNLTEPTVKWLVSKGFSGWKTIHFDPEDLYTYKFV